METNFGSPINTGKSCIFLVPASATRMAASPYNKGLAAFQSKMLGHNSDTFHQRWGLRQTTLKKCFPKQNATMTSLKGAG